jgi:hypothetical protein
VESDVLMLQKYQRVTSSAFQVERKNAFRVLSAQDKSEVVRTHLALQMAERHMNKQQLEFAFEAMALFSIDAYRTAMESPQWNELHNRLSSLKDRALVFFQKEDTAEIFASLGGKDGSSDPQNLRPNCSCSGASEYCGWWKAGASCGGGSCRGTIGGCGTGLLYDCDGMCYGGVY